MKSKSTSISRCVCLIVCIALFFTAMPTSFADEETCVCDTQCSDGDINRFCPVCDEDYHLCEGAPAQDDFEDESEEFSENEENSDEAPEEHDENTESTDEPYIDDSYLEQIGSLHQQQSQLQEEQDRLDQLIASAQSEKQRQQLIASNIDTQIALTKQSISLLEQKITITEKDIIIKEQEIDQKEAEIEDSLTLFRERIRALYLSGGGSSSASNYIAMLLSSQSMSEFLTRTEIIRRVSAHDEELITEMRGELSEIQEQKDAVESRRTALETEKAALADEQAALEASYVTASAAVQDIAAMEAEYMANREAIAAQMQQVQSEIADIYAMYNSQYTDYVGGELAWPVPGFSTITSQFGWRWNNSDFHTGMDISGSGVYGANIIAANTGTVMFVRTSGYADGYAGGYGKCLIIDHGGGISTLYAHCSDIYVSEGDVVAKGQTIAAVGSTGWSSGPHLHFEVRENGTAVNPLPYVTG